MAAKSEKRSYDKLIECRREIKLRNTNSLWEAVKRLRRQKEKTIWSYEEVCALAGLKSSNPIRASWNKDVRAEVDAHNQEVKKVANASPEYQTESKTLRNSIRVLQNEINELRGQLTNALTQIAYWEAQASDFERQAGESREINERLLARLNRR